VVSEHKYKTLSKELLDNDGESGSDMVIDNTETNLIALRRTIYFTIQSTLDFEECAHKLMKMELNAGQEGELCHICFWIIVRNRETSKFYGLLAQRFCSINKVYTEEFEEIFKYTYETTHRLDTNRLRNFSKFFVHLLHRIPSVGMLWTALN
jgi:pre-mRNA-splicing factor CWC22